MTRLATEVVESSRQTPRRRATAWATSPQALTILLYLLGALYVTCLLWVDPASRRQAGDIQDVDQATWFVRYAATAVEHFRLPALFTTAMNAPHGVNLMWNTSILLPGIVVSPVTMLAGPQVSLTVLLVIGLAGSAAAMFYVLRRWQASILAAALGGALYGFSPALINSGIGHYSLVLAMLPPLMLDRVLRIAVGRGSPVRNGVWLGLLAAAQLFISEEALIDAAIAAVILLVVLALNRRHEVLGRIRPALIGLGSAVVVAGVLCARALWVQFHGVVLKSAGATTIIKYNGHFTNLGTIPYSFITPSSTVLLHSSGTAYSADNYPDPTPEYLAYLGVLLVILLLVAIVYYWRHLTVRVAGLTCILLEWLSLGPKPLRPETTLPSFLLPWQYLQHLPLLSGMVPDRLCIPADAAAAAVLAFSLDLARAEGSFFRRTFQNGAVVATGVAIVALLPLVPSPYSPATTESLPAGWAATFNTLHLPSNDRVLLAPYPWAGTSQVMRWQANTGVPVTMIGGDFISPNKPGRQSRAGRAGVGWKYTGTYLDDLYAGDTSAAPPSPAQLKSDLAAMSPNAVVAVATPSSPLGQFLIRLFGPPTTRIKAMLGWRLRPGQVVSIAPGVSLRLP